MNFSIHSLLLTSLLIVTTSISRFPYCLCCQQFGYISDPRLNILVSIAPSVDIRLPSFLPPSHSFLLPNLLSVVGLEPLP